MLICCLPGILQELSKEKYIIPVVKYVILFHFFVQLKLWLTNSSDIANLTIFFIFEISLII